MQFDLDAIEEGQWFQFFKSEILPDGNIRYFDPEKDAGWFQIRQASVEKLEEINKKTQGKEQSSFVPHPKSRQMQRVVFYNQTEDQKKLEREMMWDYIIVSWKDIKDSHGNNIPVTLEYKMKLLNIPVFMRFLSRCLELVGEYSEASEKNS